MSAWMVRAGHNAQFAEKWLRDGEVSIFWDLGGRNLIGLSKDQIKGAYEEYHPEATPQKVATAVGQIYRFVSEIGQGETVVMYEPLTRLYHIGTVTGDIEVNRDASGDTSYKRSVRWEKESPRDLLSQSSKNSLGAISTIFSINDDVMADLAKASSNAQDPNTEYYLLKCDFQDDSEIRFATAEDGIERIKDRVLSITWEDMELLVAGFLRMLGYKTSMTSKGSDGGRDIIASPDGLGLEQPRIIAEVKHRKGQMGAAQIRAFIGGLRNSDSGLYVSTSGFSKEARYEADRATMPIRLLDLDGFVRLLVDNYDSADDEVRAILPLTRIYWPM